VPPAKNSLSLNWGSAGLPGPVAARHDSRIRRRRPIKVSTRGDDRGDAALLLLLDPLWLAVSRVVRGGWVEKIHAEYESVSIYLLGLANTGRTLSGDECSYQIRHDRRGLLALQFAHRQVRT
jgi:hypothetical protein